MERRSTTRPSRGVLRGILLASLASPILPVASAQSLDWTAGFDRPGVEGTVFAVTEFDAGDGTGRAVYVAGGFRRAGPAPARSIARWDGTSWSSLGAGVQGVVRALAVHDDGSSPSLFVGGDLYAAGELSIRGIARWDGSRWSEVGGGIPGGVRALAVFDDGSGPALYAGGDFTDAGGQTVNHVARWDGSTWSPLGSGVQFGLYGSVEALAVFDSGSGPELVAGGDFTNAGGIGANHIARWNGTSWSALGNGVAGGSASVRSLAVAGSGPGAILYASGSFTQAGTVGANNIARWNGVSWSAVGAGLGGPASALCTFDDGSAGVDLYAAGPFSTAGGHSVRFVARWDGLVWSEVGGGTDYGSYEVAVADHGQGPSLYIGGMFDSAGTVATHGIARWGGSGWLPLSTGNGLGGGARASTVLDSGSGEDLYVGGFFRTAGTRIVNGIARFDGSAWSELAEGVDGNVFALASSSNGPGGGPELYVGGVFSNAGPVAAAALARWNGLDWSALGTGLASAGGVQVDALLVTSFGPGPGESLYVGGLFTSAGGVPATGIARWDGSSWSALGSGTGSPPFQSNIVMALAVYDDGSGPALIAGGRFSEAGGVSANRIAKWNGTSWSALGSGVSGAFDEVRDLLVFDDGSGPALYVAGEFTTAGGIAARDIARWNGTSWSSLPGLDHSGGISALAVHDDGNGGGPALYAGGFFFNNGLLPNGVARWTGSGWEKLGTGIEDNYSFDLDVHALSDYAPHGSQPSLFVLGDFQTAGLKRSDGIAAWGGTTSVGRRFCAGDGLDSNVTVPCPCGNFGVRGRGCASSPNPEGGELWASGSTSPDPVTGTDTVQLIASEMNWEVTTLFVQGSSAVSGATVLGDGLRCVGGELRRLAVRTNVNGSARFPEPGELSLSQKGGVVPGSGVTRLYQTWYRDPSFGFCTPAGFNLTNGVRIVW